MAAYNNGFPMTYQPYGMAYQPQIPQLQPVQPVQTPAPVAAQAQNSNIIWIQGEAAAKSYLVAPNSSVALFDSDEHVIYMKSADSSGMPSMKILDFTVRQSAQEGRGAASAPQANYATTAELEAVKGQLAALKKQIDTFEKGVPEA